MALRRQPPRPYDPVGRIPAPTRQTRAR
jgi:hypothetical protein